VEESLKSRAPLEISAQQAGDTKTLEIANGVEMTFCWVPAGQFKMGSPESEAGRVDDEAQVKVTLTRGFWLGQTEVTQAQWEAVMGSNPSHFQGKNLPVEKVSWDMVQGFLEKANASARLPSGGKLMLPTEAQWEYACRAGERGPHSGGRIDQVAWFKDNNGGTTQPVGKKKANAWGLRDMLGNACEWCADWHADALAGGRDPQGPDAGSCRVARGGSLYYDASFCRCARRMQLDPTFTAPDLGFRVALIPVPEAR
jgi:formylglycine-generating enzyme required for sulfatase activity